MTAGYQGIKQLIALGKVRPGFESVPVKLLERGILQDRVRRGRDRSDRDFKRKIEKSSIAEPINNV